MAHSARADEDGPVSTGFHCPGVLWRCSRRRRRSRTTPGWCSLWRGAARSPRWRFRSWPGTRRSARSRTGFRSSFRDWAAECSDAPREVCELALAHVNTNSIEAAYRRTDLFERRRALMEQWAVFLTGDEAKVVKFRP